ncbi:hypothetical protein SDC9_56984 [bioreactor metagenome]|uniref:Uncharacterized protein n=1 Tax=bioreactor metagenome TaxID=1076179 RepID=A0A644X3C3_9ZZZZ
MDNGPVMFPMLLMLEKIGAGSLMPDIIMKIPINTAKIDGFNITLNISFLISFLFREPLKSRSP